MTLQQLECGGQGSPAGPSSASRAWKLSSCPSALTLQPAVTVSLGCCEGVGGALGSLHINTSFSGPPVRENLTQTRGQMTEPSQQEVTATRQGTGPEQRDAPRRSRKSVSKILAMHGGRSRGEAAVPGSPLARQGCERHSQQLAGAGDIRGRRSR